MRNFQLKLAWADHQTQTFEGQVRAWHAEGGYGIRFEPQPDSPQHVMRLHVGDTPPSLPLIIGDWLHAVRSGLDHLAYELACAYTDPLPNEAAQTSEFPIFSDREMTDSERRRKLGCVDPDAAAIIEDLQPHNRGDGYQEDPLWQLYELARFDRHRLLHITAAQLGMFAIGGDNLLVEEMYISHIGPDTKDGDEIGHCSIRPIDLNRPMHFDPNVTPDIVFKEGPFAGQRVLGILARIRQHVEASVVTPLLPFLD